MLQAVAQEALRHVRGSDVLARWGSGVFLLLMSDTHAALARGGLERVLERLAALSEHHAGEAVAQTLQRAERALQEAKTQGGAQALAA